MISCCIGVYTKKEATQKNSSPEEHNIHMIMIWLYKVWWLREDNDEEDVELNHIITDINTSNAHSYGRQNQTKSILILFC